MAGIVLNIGVLICAVYEGIYVRRGGDPTKPREVAGSRTTTINNPGYREHRHPTNGKILLNKRYYDTYCLDLLFHLSGNIGLG